MGSIAVSLSYRETPDKGRATRMIHASPHRGVLSKICTIGSASLAAGGEHAQVLVAHDLGIALSGSLDNATDLHRELASAGVTGPDDSDGAILLAAFRKYGPDVAERLRGVFAAVVTDGAQVWAFRDHIGFATLFYRLEPDRCFFATEVKQVLAGAGLPREADADVLEAIAFNELIDDTPTALKGAMRLPKATVIHVTRSASSIHRYWHPESLLETGHYTPDEIHERFDELMTQAVRRSLSGNDFVSLSGGIDSPPIASYGAPLHIELSGRPLSAISAVYPDQPAVDESIYIEEVASSLGMPLHTYTRKVKPLDNLEDWVQILDGPVPKILVGDAAEQYSLARSLGFDTMLTGEVAEFVFDRRTYALPHLIAHRRWQAAAANLRNQRRAGISRYNVARQIGSTFVPRSLATTWRRIRLPFDSTRVPHFVSQHRFKNEYASRTVRSRDRWRQEQLWAFTGPGLTMEADDVVQSIHGIRTRRPWADIDLWEFFLSLPVETKVPRPGRKALVRDLIRGKVPDSIVDRHDKTGFDDAITSRIDYSRLRALLFPPAYEVPGVDYKALSQRIEQRDLNANEFMWAKDLAALSAFVRSL